MSGNAVPQFTRQANISSVIITGNTSNLASSDGSGGTVGTNLWLAFTADATNGSYVESARFMLVGANAGTAGNATCGRIYVSTIASGSSHTTDTFLFAEVSFPVQTSDSATVATSPFDVALGFRMNPSYTILVSIGTAPATNTSYRVTVFGADY